MKNRVFVVIPNINGEDRLEASVKSVLAQTFKQFTLVIVDNGSTDASVDIMKRCAKKDPRVRNIFREKNYGYTGGVNPGIEQAIAEEADYVATFNNDAIADKNWLKELTMHLDEHPEAGAAACSFQSIDGSHYDSTGDIFTVWGLPYPRGRDEPVRGQYDHKTNIFGASGGSSLFRVSALKQVGIFDQDFFAYSEDIDLGFRLQLGGWKVHFVPTARVYHDQGSTSRSMPGFTVMQTMKNYPMVIIKDVPGRLLWRIVPRFLFAYSMFFWKAVLRGKGVPACKGLGRMLMLTPKKLAERHRIQKNRKVSAEYIWAILTHDLPPNAHKLRTLRGAWWRLRRKRAT